MRTRGFDLAAPDAEKRAELEDRIAFLVERHAEARTEHKAKRQLLDRCEAEAAHGR